MLKLTIQQLLTSAQCEGVLFFVIGPEGSGKTTLTEALVNQFSSSGMVPFSKAISAHLDSLESRKSRLVQQVRALMRQRSKDIQPSFLYSVLRDALKGLGKPQVVAIEGFLRRPDQCKQAPDIAAEFFPNHLFVCVEAVCDRHIAHERAVARKGAGDASPIISVCHDEYFRQLEIIRRECEPWSHHVQVCANGTQAETLDSLNQGLKDLAAQLRSGGKGKTFENLLGANAGSPLAA